MGRFSKENIERRFRTTFKARYGSAPLETPIPAVQKPEDIIIAVIGGAGKHSAFVPTFGATKAVTRAVTRREGQVAKSVKDFKT
jgi:hypothetical protein